MSTQRQSTTLNLINLIATLFTSTTVIGCAVDLSQNPVVLSNGHFQVIEDKIYAPDGQEFIIKGTNINGPKFGWPGDTPGYVHLIADCWRFNTVRVNVMLFDGQPYAENGTIEQIIDAYTAKGIVTIVEAHDRTGKYYEGSDLEALKAYFRDLAIQYKNNPYVWFNVMNEPGGHSSSDEIEQWLTVHREVIEAIRSVGADNIIVVDGHYWGQDVGEWNAKVVKVSKSAVLGHAQDLAKFNGKTFRNLVFSIHLYDQWDYSEAKLADYLKRVQDKQLPLIIGEYGAKKDGTFKSSVEFMFNAAVPRNVGRIVWAWWGGDDFELTTDDNGGGQHIDDCQNPTNLTWLGEQVWNDNHQ